LETNGRDSLGDFSLRFAKLDLEGIADCDETKAAMLQSAFTPIVAQPAGRPA